MADFLAGPITDPLPQRVTPASVTLVDAATISLDASLGDVFIAPITDNRTLAAPTNPKGGQRFNLIVKQPAAGGKTLTFDAAYVLPGAATLNSAANGVTVFQFVTVVSSAGVFSHNCVSVSTQQRIISGVAKVLNGASSVTVALDASYNDKPVNCTVLCAPGVKQFSGVGIVAAAISGGNLVIHFVNPGTGAAVTADPAGGVLVAYTVDGR